MGKASEARLVLAWNAAHPVGAPVTLRLDSGETRETVTRSEAVLLGGHTAAIWLQGVSGCYGLDRVTPREGSDAR